MEAVRYVTAIGFSAGVTFGLFWVMQALISADFELQEGRLPQIVDFVRLKRDTEPEAKKRELPKRQPPPQAPPPPQLNFSNNLNPDEGVGQFAPILDASLDIASATNLGAGGSDSDAVPLVRVEPNYPVRAEQRGIEGWVELMFTIGKSGSVKDAVVTRSMPRKVFDQAAIQAVQKWRYNPKVENGQIVERTGIRIRLRFQLEQ